MVPIIKLKSFSWLLFLLILISLPVYGQSSSLKQLPDSLNFLVISDFGGQGGKIQRDVAFQLGQIARVEKSKFIITAGDNYHLNGIPSASSPRWKSEYEDIYSSPSLMIPWYASLGNHDYVGNAHAEIEYSLISKRWKMPDRYYAHTEKINDTTDILFVHIDTSPFITEYRNNDSTYHVLGQDIHKQTHWIDSVLASSHALWKIVVGHHPIYSSVDNHGNTRELIDDILPLLHKYGVRFYFCLSITNVIMISERSIPWNHKGGSGINILIFTLPAWITGIWNTILMIIIASSNYKFTFFNLGDLT